MSLAIYARVSSDRQREEGTIASQVQQLMDFAADQGQCLGSALRKVISISMTAGAGTTSTGPVWMRYGTWLETV